MPNHVVLASGAVVAVSVAVATAIAIYESPEFRRYADDVRRRIAIALHSMGDNINPNSTGTPREPIFNRPEDADGFLMPHHGNGQDTGVDADEETRQRQREELMYWNSVRLEKQEKEQRERSEKRSPTGSSFDDFLRQDENAERGTMVFNTGADIRHGAEGLRNRGDGPRSYGHASYYNPFADEYQIDSHELEDLEDGHNLAPTKDEMSDIYSATTQDHEDDEKHSLVHDEDQKFYSYHEELNPEPEALIPVESTPAPSQSSATLERELGPNEYMTSGQEDRDEAYASIQAWAQNSSSNFYSPLPSTPVAPVSEPEIISDGQLTPTDSISIIGHDEGEFPGSSQHENDSARVYDVMSESEGIMTPASWSEIGSVISESDAPVPVRN